ncbi:MAG: ATP-binding protein [Paludibacteraceae bacterium]|nr:ATP-binding protein [Paludibacteraceae bacterium]
MFRRKIEATFSDWKNTPNHKPLVIKGCRQCGKTYSVLTFAKANYEHIIYLDFFKHPEYKFAFSGSLDVDNIMRQLSAAVPNAEFITGKTCIIFDEIQDCPRARTSLKYFQLDGRFDVICTGSLLGVQGYKTKQQQMEDELAPIPVGYEQIEEMYPMDFQEFLWANGIADSTIEYLRDCLHTEKPVDDLTHLSLRNLFLYYTIVGGMPAAVETFIQTNNLQKVRNTQEDILSEYRYDMIKYASATDKSRIVECFNSIPKQLARENKKFMYSAVRNNARGRDFAGCLQWIEDAGMIYRAYNTDITELPLDGNAIPSEFKVYMADTGLFVSMLEQGTAASIVQGQLGAYKGAIYENVVADILGKMGRKLYYYHKESGVELDFLFRYHNECVPIECKARTGNAKSLKTVLNNEDKYHVMHAIKLGDYNIGREGKLLTLPMYLSFLLTDF